MMSLSLINGMSRQQARKAAREGKHPFMLWPGDKEKMPPFPFPNIGSYRPKGWELVDTLFCDSSGMGSESEPALTVHQLIDALEPGFGYAIIEEGQFQVYVGKFKKLEKKAKANGKILHLKP